MYSSSRCFVVSVGYLQRRQILLLLWVTFLRRYLSGQCSVRKIVLVKYIFWWDWETVLLFCLDATTAWHFWTPISIVCMSALKLVGVSSRDLEVWVWPYCSHFSSIILDPSVQLTYRLFLGLLRKPDHHFIVYVVVMFGNHVICWTSSWILGEQILESLAVLLNFQM